MDIFTFIIFMGNLVFAAIDATIFVYKKNHDSYFGIFACLHLLVAILVRG